MSFAHGSSNSHGARIGFREGLKYKILSDHTVMVGMSYSKWK